MVVLCCEVQYLGIYMYVCLFCMFVIRYYGRWTCLRTDFLLVAAKVYETDEYGDTRIMS